MLLKLNLNDPRPLHEQVAGAIRRAIAEGSYPPGSRLPPARDLAGALGINANTVLRALRELRDEGVLEFRRGRGVTVMHQADHRSALLERIRGLLREAERYGYRREDVIKMIGELT
ncbi:GntR family transcriptional regulator [Bailinhaonella thermotolerans]|uniref:GntR family transcriptional regulator n=1 Tax=Bailinhaonella thermotolerans TaxID=1070861 RepID=A0A3A4BB64_9ACTN|nr:GntR family transcriptional regulator [Bailinhaonella thermotolerans]RJL31448.1 GntR family transcriptional regulator [Bailinhaonella thermotolerans]